MKPAALPAREFNPQETMVNLAALAARANRPCGQRGQRRWRWLTSAALLALMGCGGPFTTSPDSSPPPDGSLPVPITEPPSQTPMPPTSLPEPSATSALGLCETSVRWAQTDGDLYVLDNSFLGITPNQGLVVASDVMGGLGMMVRSHDGGIVAQGALSGLLDVDGRWQRRLEHHHDHLLVRDLITGDELMQVQAYGPSGALSDDGGRVASVACEEGVLTLTVRDIDEVTTLWNATVGEPLEACPGWSDPTPMVTFGPDHNLVVVGVPATGVVHVAHIDTHVEQSTIAHQMPGPDVIDIDGVVPSALLALATDASRSLLVTTGGDGLLKRFKLPGLIPAGEPLQVGVTAVNLSVYARPRMASPVAVSPDGEVIAAITPWVLSEDHTEVLERSVPMLLDAGTGVMLRRLELPFDAPDSMLWWEDRDRTIGLSFGPSGRTLVGRFGAGLSMWGCDEDEPPPPGAPLVVLLDGPSAAVVGEEVIFTATHLGSDALHAHTFYVNGDMVWGGGGLERTATWSFHEAGNYEVSVVIDDGISTGSMSMQITVTP